MPWNRKTAIQLSEAYYTDDIEQFKNILKMNVDNLTNEDGTDYWMKTAAMDNKLPFVEALYDLGLDINTPSVSPNPSDAFNQPEGPILWAASEGHIDIVRWFLDHSAKINYVVNGEPRCLPLIYAATAGHFGIVKLLVEHGADVHSTWQGLNAAKKAKEYGHQEIHDYLLAQQQKN